MVHDDSLLDVLGVQPPAAPEERASQPREFFV
jgi:hypothetical protein